MADLQIHSDTPLANEREEFVSDEEALKRFNQIYGSMKGTMIIVGDIVNPDPEWMESHLDR